MSARNARSRIEANTGPNRRGYAFLIAILVVLVVGFAMSIMLSRHYSQARVVGRQLEAYQLQHGARGLQDVIRAWLSTRQANQLREMLDPDGFAFTVRPGDGSSIDVWFAEGQGLMLADLGLAPVEVRQDCLNALDALRLTVGPGAVQQYTRQVGPHRVDIIQAPNPVIRALCAAVDDGDSSVSADVYDRLLQLKNDPEPSEVKLRNAIQAARMTPQQKRRLLNLVTVEPTLFRMTTELRISVGGTRGQLRAAYGALVELAQQRGERPTFVHWQDLLDDPSVPYSGPGSWTINRVGGNTYGRSSAGGTR